MKTLSIIKIAAILVLLISWNASGNAQAGGDNSSSVTENEQRIIDWLEDMSQPGVSLDRDSLLINEESTRLLNDPAYRLEMFPETYSWEQAMTFVSRQQLTQAFWCFINLYRTSDKNKELVLRSILAYDQLLQMDKILVSSFYTYIYMDLECSQFIDGKPVVFAPDIMEDKLNTLKDILYIIDKYRESKNSNETQG